jgi:excisionase family DNA binding protein
MFDRRTADCLLLDNRRMHEFVGSWLPSSHPDDPVAEPVQYEVGDDWLELLVLHDPAWGYEVHVLDRSADEVGLADVYHDLRDRLLAEAGVRPAGPARPDHIPDLGPMLSRLDRLEQLLPDLRPVLDRLDKLTAYVLQPAVKESYTVEEAADRTRLARWTIRQACNKGVITAEKVNEQWRIPHAELVRIQNHGIGRV